MTRKRGNKKKRPRIGIYCEGESEAQYFTMLSQKYNARNVHSQKINIKSMGESGKKLITESKLKGKANNESNLYVVFDRDEKSVEDIQQCRKLAKRYGITILFSSISFEIWVLMHFEPVMHSYTRKQLVNKLSTKKYFNQDYSKFKGSSYRPYLYDKIQQAEENAKKLEKIHNNMDKNDPFTNIHQHLKEIFNVDIL